MWLEPTATAEHSRNNSTAGEMAGSCNAAAAAACDVAGQSWSVVVSVVVSLAQCRWPVAGQSWSVSWSVVVGVVVSVVVSRGQSGVVMTDTFARRRCCWRRRRVPSRHRASRLHACSRAQRDRFAAETPPPDTTPTAAASCWKRQVGLAMALE